MGVAQAVHPDRAPAQVAEPKSQERVTPRGAQGTPLGEGKTVTCSSMGHESEGGPEFDVVIVGSGAAGMTAALTAAHLGLSALVIEKARSFGGATGRPRGGGRGPGPPG